MNKFSIIIPVYNSEKTIKRCLNSLTSQTYKNFEVLLIDDGSTDNSLNILTKYANNDSRFKVFHQKNSGPSSARNKGLDNSSGNIICFIDSDDYVIENYLEELNNKFNDNNADLVFFSYNKFNENGIISTHTYLEYDNDYFKNINGLSSIDMFGYTWIKAIKRNVIGDTRFDNSLSLFEDEVFICNISKPSLMMSYIDKPIYNYYVDNYNSLIRKTYDDYYLKCEKVYNAWKNMLKQQDYMDEFLKRKANGLTKNCIYYGLERNVDYLSFYKELSNCTFFKESNIEDEFLNAIRKNDFFSIKSNRFKYKIKNKIVTLLKQ